MSRPAVVGICSIYLSLLWGCDTQYSPPELTSEPTPKPTPGVRLAPQGVFYVIKSFSITTESGILGFPLGKSVNVVSEDNGAFVIDDRGEELTVDRVNFSNDLDVVEPLLETASNQLRVLHENHRIQNQQRESQKQEFEATRASKTQREASAARASERRNISTAIADLDTRIALAEREISQKNLRRRETRYYYRDGIRYSQASQIVTFSKDASNIKDLYLQRSRLQRRLEELR